MSPFSTFHNSGSSSSLYLRSLAPKGVMRDSPAMVTGDMFSSSHMVRNLCIRKGLPSLPMRSCTKKTGLPILAFTSSAMTSKRGHRTRSPIKATVLSKMGLKNIKILCYYFFTTIAGTPTAVQCPGMGFVTTAPAPMFAYSPMEI